MLQTTKNPNQKLQGLEIKFFKRLSYQYIQCKGDNDTGGDEATTTTRISQNLSKSQISHSIRELWQP